MGNPRDEVWTIASGQTLSDAIDKEHLDLVGIEMPAAFTGANLAFYGSNTSKTASDFGAITFEGVALTMAVAADGRCTVDPVRFIPWRFIKIESDAAEGDDREVIPRFRNL